MTIVRGGQVVYEMKSSSTGMSGNKEREREKCGGEREIGESVG